MTLGNFSSPHQPVDKGAYCYNRKFTEEHEKALITVLESGKTNSFQILKVALSVKEKE